MNFIFERFLKRTFAFGFLILGFAFSDLALAQRESLEDTIKLLEESVFVGTNGGDSNVYKYDLKTFKYGPLVKSLLENIEESTCKFTAVIGRKSFFEKISNFHIIRGAKTNVAEILKKLAQKLQIKAIIGYFWDGENGDSEYCTKERLEVYFKNGRVLRVDLDSTT